MKHALFLCMIIALLSCATTSPFYGPPIPVESRKSPEFNSILERIYIIIHTADLSIRGGPSGDMRIRKEIPLSSYLAGNIDKSFQEVGVASKTSSADSIEFTEEGLKTDVEAFSPQALMSVELTKITRSSYYVAGGDAVFDIKVYYTSLGKTIWRCKFEIGLANTTDADRLIFTIISAMQQDALVAAITPAQ